MDNSKNHHFTVVIPTRERSDTLEHSLHTCVIQDYDDLEILISDNFSQDRTREVVESYKDPRIRYVNTGKRLGMTDNFEFALSHVPPKGYVIYIGDDDSLLPGAIRDINAVIVQTGAQVLRWDRAHYWWPAAESKYANQLFINSLGSGTTVRKSEVVIQDLLSFKRPSYLPMMYSDSAIAYGVIRKIKDASGRFYHSMVPDAYSGFAIAGTVGSFINSKRPYTIAGLSHHSTGLSTLGLSLTGPAIKFLAEDNLLFHSSLVFCPSTYQCDVECFLQARDHLPSLRKFTVDWEKLVFSMMLDASPKAQEIYTSVKDAVLHIGKTYNIPEAAKRAIAANPRREPGYARKPTVRNIASAGLYLTHLLIEDISKGSFHLDCSSLNVKNIYDASILCDHILRLKDMGVLGFSAVLKSSLANIKRKIAPDSLHALRRREIL